MANQRLKIKQLSSGQEPYGKHLTADGNSGFTWSDDIASGTGQAATSNPLMDGTVAIGSV